MPAKSIKSFRGMICEGNSKVLSDENCARMVNMIALENKFQTRKGYKKYNSVPYPARINLIYQFRRIVGGTLNIIGFGDSLFVGEYVDPWAGYTAITNCEELQAMQNDLAGNYYLANDIDASATSGWNGGAGFAPVGAFTGIFDGNGHTITGLFIDRPSIENVGLFGGRISSVAEIKNVGVINVDISGQNYTGGLVGFNNGSTITNCYSTGVVSGNNDAFNIGGLVGLNYGGGTIINCFSMCAVSKNSSDDNIGGLVGLNYGGSTIINCYCTGYVSGACSFIGGLVGRDNGTTTDSFWDTQTSGQATSAGGTGKTTAQMKQEATFTNWDFATIWAIVEDTSYPTLR